MSRMDESSVLFASGAGSLSALWSRIDAGTFPNPIVISPRGCVWDSDAVQRAISIHSEPEPEKPEQREQPQPPATTRERKDDSRTEDAGI